MGDDAMTEQADQNQHQNGAPRDALRHMATRHRARAAREEAAFVAALRVAFGRMCSDCPGLDGVVQDVSVAEGALAEVLELAEPGMFLALLDGPGDRMGLLMACPSVLAGMVEAQTTGRVDAAPLARRRPTRTDAALLAPLVDAFLRRVEQRCADLPQAGQVAGFCYGSFLDDPRPLGLVLEDGLFTILRLQVALGFGARTGKWVLILPLAADAPDDAAMTAQDDNLQDDWDGRLQAAVAASPVVVDAVLCRLKLTLTDALRLRPGDILRVPETALESLSLEGLGPVALGIGRLGQARGQRAARMTADPGQRQDAADGAHGPLCLPASVVPLRPLQPAFVPPHDRPEAADPADMPASATPVADAPVIQPEDGASEV